MKALTLLLGLLLFCSEAMAQEVIMRIHMKNGSEMRINTDSVKLMSATATVEHPRFWLMHLSIPFGYYARDEYDYESDAMDSLRFEKKSGVVTLKLKNGHSYGVGPIARGDSFTDSDTLKFRLYSLNTSVSTIGCAGWPGQMATAWHDTTLFAASPLTKYTLNSQYALLQNSDMNEENFILSIDANDAGDRLVYSNHDEMYTGRLVENNLSTGVLDVLTPNDSMVTTAHYMPMSNNIVYYSFGSYNYELNRNPDDAGYYLLDRTTGQSTMLLKHLTLEPTSSVVNCFDLSHDGKKLLFSGIKVQSTFFLIEFDLQTKETDTLQISIPKPKYLVNSLWVQYNNDDTRILYSLSDFGLGPSPVGWTAEVGIFDRATKSKQILDVAPDNVRPFCTPFPRWSPDNKAICYGSARIPYFVLDTIDPFCVYIKKL